MTIINTHTVVNLMVEILLLGLLSTFQKVALNKKKNRNSIDHIPLWNLPTNSQSGSQLNLEKKE